jgi:hypothetical protein
MPRFGTVSDLARKNGGAYRGARGMGDVSLDADAGSTDDVSDNSGYLSAADSSDDVSNSTTDVDTGGTPIAPQSSSSDLTGPSAQESYSDATVLGPGGGVQVPASPGSIQRTPNAAPGGATGRVPGATPGGLTPPHGGPTAGPGMGTFLLVGAAVVGVIVIAKKKKAKSNPRRRRRNARRRSRR